MRDSSSLGREEIEPSTAANVADIALGFRALGFRLEIRRSGKPAERVAQAASENLERPGKAGSITFRGADAEILTSRA